MPGPRVLLPPHLSAWLRARVTELASETDASPIAAPAVARATGALPIYLDLDGWIALDPEGRLLAASWDHAGPPREEADSRWRTVALVEGARRYPALAPLVPARPTGAPDCPICRGRGRLAVGEAIEAGCARCWGLGWDAPGG